MQRTHCRFGKGFRVLIGNARGQAAQMVVMPGQSEGGRGNRHRGADQWLFVVAGRGIATVNGRRITLRPGALLLIERNDEHEIRNTGRQPLKTINLYVPPAYSRSGEERSAGRSS